MVQEEIRRHRLEQISYLVVFEYNYTNTCVIVCQFNVMYSFAQRANAVFAYFTTVLFTMLGCIALTSPFLLYYANPLVSSISTADIQVYQIQIYNSFKLY